MRSRESLIDELSADLAPARPFDNARLVSWSLGWLVLSAVYVLAVTAVSGPFRPGFADDLGGSMQFLGEIVFGVATVWIVMIAGLSAAIPGRTAGAWTIATLAAMAGWVCFTIMGLSLPAIEPSMLGKRPHCVSEAIAISGPPIVVGVYALRRLFPLKPIVAGIWCGTASGMLPAIAMQLACMYSPEHALQFHMAPIVVSSALGGVLAYFWCRNAVRN